MNKIMTDHLHQWYMEYIKLEFHQVSNHQLIIQKNLPFQNSNNLNKYHSLTT